MWVSMFTQSTYLRNVCMWWECLFCVVHLQFHVQRQSCCSDVGCLVSLSSVCCRDSVCRGANNIGSDVMIWNLNLWLSIIWRSSVNKIACVCVNVCVCLCSCIVHCVLSSLKRLTLFARVNWNEARAGCFTAMWMWDEEWRNVKCFPKVGWLNPGPL